MSSSISASIDTIIEIRDLMEEINFKNIETTNNYTASTASYLSDQILKHAATLKELSDARIKDIRENGPSLVFEVNRYTLGLLRDDKVKYVSCTKGCVIEVSSPQRFTSIRPPAWETYHISGFDKWVSEDEANIIMKKLGEFN
jgi:hypothetical protein